MSFQGDMSRRDPSRVQVGLVRRIVAARSPLGGSPRRKIAEMTFMDDAFDRAVDVAGRVAKVALVPWGGAEACVDAWEAAVRAATDVQLNTARAIAIEPARSVLASCADLTRDIGATQLSSMRWILDV